MSNLWKLFKSGIYAVLFMLLVGVILTLLAWTKGLVLILFVFIGLVYLIYQQLSYRERTMRRQDRGWLS